MYAPTKALAALLSLAVEDPDLFCLTATVYGEARSESELGQAVVAQVVLNRVASQAYPASVCEVVTARKQFAGYGAAWPQSDRQLVVWDKVKNVVSKVRSSEFQLGACGKATHFHSVTEAPYWAKSLSQLCRVDNHVFYK